MSSNRPSWRGPALTPRPHGRVVGSSFAPHPLLRNPHLQTVLALARMRGRPPWTVEALETDDGDEIRIGWRHAESPCAPTAVLVHGLAGGLRSAYAVTMGDCLARRGWCVVMLELRGAGERPNRLARGYHHGDTDDLRAVCQLLRRRRPQAPMAAIGWSLGANIVLKALGEDGAGSPLDAGVAISAPFDLQGSARMLRQSGRAYQFLMMRTLKARLRRKHRLVPVPAGVDLGAAQSARDFFEFGDAYIAPCNGFRDSADYCERAGCRAFLRDIARPTLIVQSTDDPILGSGGLPTAAELPADVTLELASAGGHAGFVTLGPFWAPAFWLEQRVPQYLHEALAPAARRLEGGTEERAASGSHGVHASRVPGTLYAATPAAESSPRSGRHSSHSAAMK